MGPMCTALRRPASPAQGPPTRGASPSRSAASRRPLPAARCPCEAAGHLARKLPVPPAPPDGRIAWCSSPAPCDLHSRGRSPPPRRWTEGRDCLATRESPGLAHSRFAANPTPNPQPGRRCPLRLARASSFPTGWPRACWAGAGTANSPTRPLTTRRVLHSWACPVGPSVQTHMGTLAMRQHPATSGPQNGAHTSGHEPHSRDGTRVCIYAHEHTRAGITRTDAHIYAHRYDTHVKGHTRMETHVFGHACIRTRIDARIHTRVNAHMRKCACTYAGMTHTHARE